MPLLPGLADQFPLLKKGHCKHIRSKEMFYDVDRDDVPDYAGRHYWCQHTQTCLGPDGIACEMKECEPGRSCFERI